MRPMPFASWPCFTQEEADAISRVLLSNKVNYWTGKEAQLFEKEFAAFVDTKYAIALANGTVALEASFLALGVQGGEVIVTSRTFMASISSIVLAGAVPVFVDIDPDSQNITPETIEKAITPRTKAILCVHLAGWPCEMDGILALAKQHSLFVVEDCAQAHGALYKGRPVGSLGHIAAFSFCQDKIMTTGGEGGMVTTNDRKLFAKVWSYKDHGKSWNMMQAETTSQEFRWLHESFGTNGRLTEMQAAIGRIQLKRMPHWHKVRQENAMRIWTRAQTIPGLRVPIPPAYIEHAAYKCYLFVRKEYLIREWNTLRIIDAIAEEEVPCFQGSCSEVYLEKAFENTAWRPQESLQVAKELGETSLTFLVHPTLSQKEIDITCSVLEKVMVKATGGAFCAESLEY